MELAEMARKVQAAQEGLHDYIGAITAAQEEERMRLARETSQADHLQVDFQLSGQERRLSGEVELALYRIQGEAGRGTRLSVRLAFPSSYPKKKKQ